MLRIVQIFYFIFIEKPQQFHRYNVSKKYNVISIFFIPMTIIAQDNVNYDSRVMLMLVFVNAIPEAGKVISESIKRGECIY